MNPTLAPYANPHRPPAGTVLCPAEEVGPGVIRRFRYGPYEDGFRGFLIRTALGGLRGYIDWCPHMGVPLQDERHDILCRNGSILCQWHLASFSPEDGRVLSGPAAGLAPWPVEIGPDGMVRTV